MEGQTRIAQKEIIRQHLLSGGKLTSLTALQLCGSLRASERIRELESEGMAIKHTRIKVGEKHVMEYSVEAEQALYPSAR